MSTSTAAGRRASYAIIGSGNIGTALARLFTRAGIACSIANSRGPESIRPLVEELGDTVVAKDLQAALSAEVVVLAIPFMSVEKFGGSRDDWSGKIIIDATNANTAPQGFLNGRLSSDIVAAAFRGASVVKTFNYLPARVLERDPAQNGGRRVMFIAGNDAAANDTVQSLVQSVGFAPIALGRIDEGGRLLHQIPGPLVLHDLVEYPLE